MPVQHHQTSKSSLNEPVVNIAAYKFVGLSDLPNLRLALKSLGIRLGLKGTILLSSEGINLFLAGSRSGVDDFLRELTSDTRFADLEIKESFTDVQPFRRMLVKIKREIIPCGKEEIVPQQYTSRKISPHELRQWLVEGRDFTLLDVRNDYEVRLGSFQGARHLGIKHFRAFEEAVQQGPIQNKDRTVVMYCTGGIRCEKAGPLMERLGFQRVFQLDGGILRYFEECGGEFYEGSCFVFDHRVAVDPHLRPAGVSQCFACQSTLSREDLASEQYREGVSCPHCFVPAAERVQRERRKHQAALQAIALRQPGCIPYDNHRRIHVPKHLANRPTLDFLLEMFPGTSPAHWQAKLELRQLLNDQGPVTADHLVREGERIVHVEPNTVEPAVASDIKVLYEDSQWIVVNKPAPLPVHPCGRYNRNTLQNFLNHAYQPDKIRLPHRLDAWTTGLIVALRRRTAAQAFQRLQLEGKVHRTYLAKVTKKPSQSTWTCDIPISESPSKHGSRLPLEEGLTAVTHFRVVGPCVDGTYLLEATPVTGRTHQIRVHLWHAGMPVVNDPLYLPDGKLGVTDGEDLPTKSLGLHAWKISFPHWETGERLEFEAAPPDTFGPIEINPNFVGD